MDRRTIRAAFCRPTTRLARVTPQGFLVDDVRHQELVGRLDSYQLLRKRFEDGELVCDAPDGVNSRTGQSCQACLHPQCRPQLRLRLRDGPFSYLIDLAVTSAENLFAIEDDAAAEGCRIEDWHLRITIKPRGGWGEVRFERHRS
jgi:hypothetical protein